MSTIVVTGGAGYIGSHTCRELASQGYAPVVFDNLSEGHRWAVRYGPIVEGHLADTDLLRGTLEQLRPEAIIHFAAHAYVGESMNDPLKYFRNNVAGTISLLEAMQAARVDRLVFSSTCATYGMPAAIPIGENQPQVPVNPYGESKLFVERMLAWTARTRGMKYVALRYFNAAGADIGGELGESHDPETHLVPLAIHAALGLRDHLDVFGTDYGTPDGTAIRDYIHVTDLARAHVAALQYLTRGGTSGAFNLGTGVGVSVREVIRSVERVSQRRVPVAERPRRDGDPEALVADPRRAQTVLGWQPRHSDLTTIVETAWRWHERTSRGGLAAVAASATSVADAGTARAERMKAQ
jgi:UDP-arabinose 4-epimerase